MIIILGKYYELFIVSGVPSYEIIWGDPHNYFKGLVSENQIFEGKVDPEKLWSTIEPQIIVEKAYPELVEAFKQSKIKPPKPSKRKKKQKECDNKENTSTTAPVVKKARKTKSTKNKNSDDQILTNLENSFKQLHMEKDKNKHCTMDNFLKRAVLNNAQNYARSQVSKEKDEILFDEKFIQTSTPSKNVNKNWYSFYDDDDDADLSDIIEGIIARKPALILEKNLKKLNFNLIEENEIHGNDDNNSSFFVNKPIENDLFEKTYNELIYIDSDDSTEEYDLQDIDNILTGGGSKCDIENQQFEKNQCVEDNTEKAENTNEKDETCDSFLGSDIAIPLIERLKMKKRI